MGGASTCRMNWMGVGWLDRWITQAWAGSCTAREAVGDRVAMVVRRRPRGR